MNKRKASSEGSSTDPCPVPAGNLYGFGNTMSGQLGLGGIEEDQIRTPREVLALKGQNIGDIACGVDHTLFIIDYGTVHSCGNNDYGQLGHNKSRKKPERVDVLETQSITQVACGYSHSVALSECGKIYTWGDNTRAQLGRGSTAFPNVEDEAFIAARRTPRVVPSLNNFIVVQVACGYYHTIVLTNSNRLFSWGDNSHGQLGVTMPKGHLAETPTEIRSLDGVPIAQIASGGQHSFALSASGSLFGWGFNGHGQLGVGSEIDSSFPTKCKSLRSQFIKYVSCGEDHTAVLTKDGGVFTFGAGMYGQLGHNANHSEKLPRKVFELMGSTVDMIACGRRHTLAHVAATSRIYAFGLGGNGQLGVGGSTNNRLTPTLIQDLVSMATSAGQSVYSLYAGGDQSFVFCMSAAEKGYKPCDYRTCRPLKPVLTLSEAVVERWANKSTNGKLPPDLANEIELIFSSSACLNGSFLLPDDRHYSCGGKNSGICMHSAQKTFSKIEKLDCTLIIDLLASAIERVLLRNLSGSPPDAEALRLYLTLPYLHLFNTPENYPTIICPFGSALVRLGEMPSRVIGQWLSQTDSKYLTHLITIFKNTLVHILLKQNTPMPEDQQHGDRLCLYICLEVLKKIQQVNEMTPMVPCETFYVSELRENVNLQMDYVAWIQQQLMGSVAIHNTFKRLPVTPEGHSRPYCNYPFLFDGLTKTTLLHIDAMYQMQSAVDEVARRNVASLFLPIDPVNPCLVLIVSRDNIVSDTIAQITKQPTMEYKKPLRVVFTGEEAQDAGGVKKEFFLLLLREVLDPKYGMFQYYEESRLIWFEPASFEDRNMYELIGTLCGLAIYNRIIINISLPLALYKKLLKRPVGLEDLAQVQPEVARSLQMLLDYAGNDVEDAFGICFEVTREVYGNMKTLELIPGGSTIPVTADNKHEYVDRFVDFFFNTSVKDQYEAFSDGFFKVCGSRILELFQPSELQAMVVGNENYDWQELEKNTEYKGVFTREHSTIQMFWDVFHNLDLSDKKKFLLFLTGSDRIPILGMSAVKMYIQSVNVDEEFLPVAHTCFNLLDLPIYTQRETLRRKLLQAIQHTHGFGLV